ncbi:DUF4956 domain-containing protein [Candidatus Neomarinimicrobiota bacterium]
MPDPAAASNITIMNGQIWELVVRFAFNFVIAFLLIRLIYYRFQKNPTYAFTYFMFNVLIFFVCYLLSNVTLSIGFAFGLFAVFAILRYRTDPIPIKEMTYLFMVITIGVMNALSTPDISLMELLFANGAIVLVAFGMESYWRKTTLNEVLVIYENIENIKPENQNALLSDLRKRTGLDIVKYKMVRTDFLRDIARIRVYYRRSNDQE